MILIYVCALSDISKVYAKYSEEMEIIMDNSDKFEKVYSVGNSVTADLLVGILQNNGIAAFKQGDGPGEIMDIYGQNSIFGESIYVKASDMQRSSELIEECMASAEDL